MRIGLDFDNTIICYDGVFRSAAAERGLLPAGFDGSKQQVRDSIRLLPDGELKWQALQGHVYGKGIGGACMFAGLDSFLRRAHTGGHSLVIVSHKTQYGHFDPDRVDLREAALGWMEANGFFAEAGFSLRREDVHFASTRSEKLQRIATVGCDVFIDDLEEVLDDPAFPRATHGILFSAQADPASGCRYTVCHDWRMVEEVVFGDGR